MLDHILAVRRMQDYIAAHLDETITAADLARAAGYSFWHANRLFSFWLNITPAGYIRRLRLSRAALQLRDEKVRVLDAAVASGFDSAEGFQRAFRREFGCNPREYAHAPSALRLFTPYALPVEKKEKNNMMENKKITVQLVSRPRRKVIIKRGVSATHYFEYCEEVGCDVWGVLTSIPSLCGEPVCMWLPQSLILPGTSAYVQGVELPADETFPVPEGYEEILLPEGEFLMLQGEPFADEDFEEAISQIWEAEKTLDPAEMGYAWDDSNPRIQLEPRGQRGYIEFLPVVKKA